MSKLASILIAEIENYLSFYAIAHDAEYVGEYNYSAGYGGTSIVSRINAYGMLK